MAALFYVSVTTGKSYFDSYCWYTDGLLYQGVCLLIITIWLHRQLSAITILFLDDEKMLSPPERIKIVLELNLGT